MVGEQLSRVAGGAIGFAVHEGFHLVAFAAQSVLTLVCLGSVLRYLLGGWFKHRMGPEFPWGTLAVNVLGNLALGLPALLFGVHLGLAA